MKKGCLWSWNNRGCLGKGFVILMILSLISAIFNPPDDTEDNQIEINQTAIAIEVNTAVAGTSIAQALTDPVETFTPSGVIPLSDFALTPIPTDVIPTETNTPEPSATITDTPTLIPSATITDTPIASFLQNTLSPESQSLLTEVVSSISSGSQAETLILNSLRGRDDVSVRINEWVPSISTEFRMNASVWGAEQDILKVTCELKESGLIPDFVYIFVAQVELVDRFGNITVESGVTAQLRPETVAKMNCDNRGFIELSSIADSHRIHPALR